MEPLAAHLQYIPRGPPAMLQQDVSVAHWAYSKTQPRAPTHGLTQLLSRRSYF